MRPFIAAVALGTGSLLGAQPEVDPEALAWWPCAPGETLSYDISWSFFHVGEAVLTTEGPVDYDGRPCLLVTLKARTNSFADAFYKVRNESKVWIDIEYRRPLRWDEDQDEGGTVRQSSTRFDWGAGTVTYWRNGEAREPLEVPPNAWDPLSIVVYVRTLAFAPGDFLEVPTTNGKRNMITEIDVVKRREVEVEAGKFNALVLAPDTKDLGGVFKKSKEASIEFWYSEDALKLPLRMKSSVKVGSFTAELESYSGLRGAADPPSLIEKAEKAEEAEEAPTRRGRSGR